MDPFERLAELRERFSRAHPRPPSVPATDGEFEEMIREARAERSIRADEDDQRIVRESRQSGSH